MQSSLGLGIVRDLSVCNRIDVTDDDDDESTNSKSYLRGGLHMWDGVAMWGFLIYQDPKKSELKVFI
jgi:hypothetical protein